MMVIVMETSVDGRTKLYFKLHTYHLSTALGNSFVSFMLFLLCCIDMSTFSNYAHARVNFFAIAINVLKQYRILHRLELF